MRKNYDLLSAQIEYYQSSLLGRSNMYAQSIVMIFDIEKSDEELRKIGITYGRNHDISYLMFTKDEKQYFMDEDEGNRRIDEIVSEVIHVNSKEEVYSFAKDNVNNENVNIFEKSFYFKLLKGKGFSAFVLTGHHTMYDGFCVPLVIEEVSYYMGLSDNIIEFGKYEKHIAEELDFKNTKRFIKDKEFWNKTLTDDISYSIFTEEISDEHESNESRFRFTYDESNKFRAFVEENNLQISSFIYAITSVFLNRVTGKEKFTLGIPVLNRISEDEFKTMGMYLHTLPLVCEVEDKSFIEVCEHIEDSAINLLRHQKFTQHDIRKNCETGERNLFDTVCDYQGYFHRPKDDSVVEYDIAFPNSLPLNYEIHFKECRDGRIEVITRYRKSVFTKSAISNMEDALHKLALKMVSNSDMKVSDIKLYDNPLILYGEKKEVPEKTLFEIFMDTAKTNLDSIAIEFDDSSYTYKELFCYAKKIGEQVTITDMSPVDVLSDKSPIAVLSERSIEMYAAIYGTQYLNCPYLPILPEWPLERIIHVLRDSKAKTIIYQGKYESLVKSLNCNLNAINATETISNADNYVARNTNINESTINNLVAKNSVTNKPGIDDIEICSDIAYSPEELSYVIYTSGSTGKAKGAKISQKSIVNRIYWMNEQYGLGKNDSILQKTPYSFDVSVWELFWWAFTGAKLSVIPPEMHFEPARIIEAIVKHRVTHIHFVPSVFRIFVMFLKRNTERVQELESLKNIFLSGEMVEAEYVNMLYEMLPKVRIHNLYGPTECAVDVTYHEIKRNEDGLIPIGRPVFNTNIYLVDSFNNVLPTGMTGEIVVSGRNVGEGYINNKKLSELVFSYDKESGDKVYFTGDFGYIDDNDEVVYVGRKDSQLKINGQRVDLKEIEKTVTDIEGILDCTVQLEKLGKKNYVVLFYVKEEGFMGNLKSLLCEKLPMFMVPTYIISVDEIPIGYSGKLDKQKLRDSFEEYLNSNIETETGEEPVGPVETEIAECFKAILGIDKVLRDTSFIKYKTSSLDIVSLLSSSELFDKLTGKDIMVNSTPRLLARFINGEKVRTETIIKLYQGTGDEAVVIFPYAAGKEESFIELVRELNMIKPELSIYFIGFDALINGRVKDYAEEIIELSKNMKVTFYSHCAGSAIALNLLYMIRDITGGHEKEVVVRHVLAASTPSISKNGRSPWRTYPDFVMKTFMRMAKAKKDLFEPEKLELFKNESDYFFELCKEDNILKNGTHNVPTEIILWKKDVFTGNSENAKELWSRFIDEVRGIYFIETDTHYFQSHNADEIAKYIVLE